MDDGERWNTVKKQEAKKNLYIYIFLAQLWHRQENAECEYKC